MCPHSYFLQYVLGWRSPSGQKATMGSIVHKALEGLARKKLAMQNGEATFHDDELGRTFDVATFEPELATEVAYEHYSKKETHHKWGPRHFKQTRQWMYDAMELNGGRWNPLNRDVVMPEQFFDFPIEQDWARYSYPMPDGTRLDGHLGLKGTVDLITRVDSDTLEYIDWKSGMRKDWATGKEKNWKDLRDDPQLRIYHYALSRLYPDVKHIVMTIVFIQAGGAYPLDFGPKDLAKTERMVRERFETIRGCSRPPRIIHDRAHKWKCGTLCHFGKTNHLDEQGKDTGKTLCQHTHNEILALGMDRVVAKYSKGNAFASYGDGGGQSNRDEKEAATAA